MSDWQPIETAPKDGTLVLLAYLVPGDEGDELETAFGYWTGRGWWKATFRNPPIAVYDEGIAKDFCAVAIEPTHWMPLPPPPDLSEKPEAQ